MVGYMGFAGYVFFRRKHLLWLPEGPGVDGRVLRV